MQNTDPWAAFPDAPIQTHQQAPRQAADPWAAFPDAQPPTAQPAPTPAPQPGPAEKPPTPQPTIPAETRWLMDAFGGTEQQAAKQVESLRAEHGGRGDFTSWMYQKYPTVLPEDVREAERKKEIGPQYQAEASAPTTQPQAWMLPWTPQRERAIRSENRMYRDLPKRPMTDEEIASLITYYDSKGHPLPRLFGGGWTTEQLARNLKGRPFEEAVAHVNEITGANPGQDENLDLTWLYKKVANEPQKEDIEHYAKQYGVDTSPKGLEELGKAQAEFERASKEAQVKEVARLKEERDKTLPRVRKLLTKDGILGANLDDRRGFLEQLREIPKEEQEALVTWAPEFLYQERQREKKDPTWLSNRAWYPMRVAEGFKYGWIDTAQSVIETVGAGGDDSEIRVARTLRDLYRSSLGAARSDDPWWTKAPVQAAHMTPAMTQAIRGGELGSAFAAGAKSGAVGMKVSQLAGMTIAMYPQTYMDSYSQLRDDGVDSAKAKIFAGLTAVAVGALEGIIPDPTKGVGAKLSTGLRQKIAQYTTNYAKNYAGEWSEEGAQGFASGLGRVLATHLDKEAPDLPWKTAYDDAMYGFKSSAAPLAVMALGTAGARAIGDKYNALPERPEQAEQPIDRPAITETPSVPQEATAPQAEPEATPAPEVTAEPQEAAPGAQEQAPPERSDFYRRVEDAVTKVPSLEKASFEVDDNAKTATVTLSEGQSTTVHFDADKELAGAGKRKGKKTTPYGAYVRDAGKGGLVTGDIYLRSDVNHKTLNHEIVHWLQDLGIVTETEMDEHGGREGFAKAYEEWVVSDQAEERGVFTRVMDFMKRLLGDADAKQQQVFRELPGRIPEAATEQSSELSEAEPQKSLGMKAEAADNLATLKMPELRQIAKTEGVNTKGMGSLKKTKLVELIRADRDAKTVPESEPEPEAPTQEVTALPEGFWEHQPLALKTARGMLGAKRLDDALLSDAAEDGLKKALETYSHEKANGKPLEAWIKQVVRQKVGEFAKRQAGNPEKSGIENVPELTDGPAAPSHAEASDKAMNAVEAIKSQVPKKHLGGLRALQAKSEGLSYAKQAKKRLGQKASTQEVESLRRKLGRQAKEAEEYIATNIEGNAAEAVKEWENTKSILRGPKKAVTASPLPSGDKAPSTGQVVKAVAASFQVPIRMGHFRDRKAAGIYKQLEEVARIRNYGDIAAATHEAAHHLDKAHAPLQGITAAMRAELASLDYVPKRGDAHEGFAEYVRHRLTMDDAAAVAPKFDDWFTNSWLPKNQAAADAFSNSKAAVDQWRNAGALSRVNAQIDMGESRWKKIGRSLKRPNTLLEWVTDNWYNRLGPLYRESKRMTGTKTLTGLMDTMDADANFWAFAKVSNMAAAARVRGWAKFGVADVQGNKLGPGLKETLAPIANQLSSQQTLQDFYSYCYARHALDVIAQGKEPGISRQDAQFVVSQFDAKPGWKEASDGITDWHSALIDYLVDAGGLTAEAANTMKGMYPHYIALARKMDSEFLGRSGAGGNRYANLPSALKRLKGSGREILPPLESALAYAERIVGQADKVRVGRMLVEASEKYNTLGDTVEQVDPKTVSQSVAIESLESQLKRAGADLSQADMDAMLTVFSQEFTGDPKDNVLTLYRNGKRECYYVRDDLYRALVAFDKPARLPEILDRTIGGVARMIRLGTTGLKPGFSLLTNPMRDISTALMQTEYQPRNPFSIMARSARGVTEEIVGSEVSQIWERGGGPMAQPLGIDRKFLEQTVHELLAQTPQAKVLNWMKHPIDSLRSVFSVPESGPRLAEMRASLEGLGWKPGKKVTFEQYVKSQLSAANVTVDFREGGTLAMWLNQIIPFFNPSLQGPHRMASAMRSHPVATVTTGILWLTLPTLLLWYRQKDEEWYKQLTPMERYRYIHIKLPGMDAPIRIPKPFEWGHFFSSMPEGAMQTLYDENPEAFNESVGVAIEDMTPNIIPGFAEAPIEIAANRDFYFDRSLVPQSLQRALPEDQYNPYTSETAKRIGALFGVSPIYVEHLASGWTGGLATDVVKSAESAAGFATKKTRSQITGGPSALPFAGRLFLSPLHTRVFDDFYTKLEKLEAEHGSAKLKGEAEISDTLSYMRGVSRELSELRKQSRSILDSQDMTDDQKREKFLEIHSEMIGLAKETDAVGKEQ